MVGVAGRVLKRGGWSAVDIGGAVWSRKLPVPHGSFDPGLLEIALIYALMIASLAALFLPRSPKVLPIISIVGSLLSWLSRWWNVTFRWTFFPYFGQVHEILAWNAHIKEWHMRVGPAWWILPWIVPALLA